MASAKDFVVRVNQIEGVEGCLLVNTAGSLLSQTLSDPERYSALMLICGNQVETIMTSLGLNYCRFLTFSQQDNRHFHIFPMGKFLLGVMQTPDCQTGKMLEDIQRLVGKVSTT